jgi:Zn-finger nucleic acid-binding protein
MSGPCPRDQSALNPISKRLGCTSCHGIFVDNDDLATIVRAMAPDLHGEIKVPFHDRSSKEPALACAICTQPMKAVRLGTMPVDHCFHGVWFDGQELQKALQSIGEAYGERETMRDRTGPAGGHNVFMPQQWTGEESFGQMLNRLVRSIFRRG